MKIVMAGQFDDQCKAALAEQHELATYPHEITDPASLQDADALVIRGHVRVDADLLERAPRLGLIVKAGSGTDNIDMRRVQARGIEVTTTPASSGAVAELALLLVFAVQRCLPELDTAVRQGDWAAKYRTVGEELAGKRAGVVGFGRIGRAFAHLATGVGMTVKAYDRSPDNRDKRACAERLGVDLTSLDDVISEVDVLSLHMPLTSQTHGLLGDAELQRMRDGAVLVNTARAELVDREALFRALSDGPLAGAGLDVHYEEPARSDDPLLSLRNVVATPHVGAQTRQTHREIGRQIVAAVQTFATRGAAV